MTHNPDGDVANDVVDRVAGLAPGSAAHTLRHRRDKVATATQRSYDTLFDPALVGLALGERLLVALYASRLAPSPALAAHYRAELDRHGVDAAARAAVETGTPDDVADPRLRAMLAFTRTLIENPVAGDRAALETLPAAGLTTPEVVALAQLVAFLSYQTRLVAGLRALDQLEATT
nr:CMD domain protein [Burkholderia guangdongensis]